MRWVRVALVLAALGLAASEAPAQEPAAGRFITVIGDVQVLSKDASGRRLAARSSEIRAGESIVTGKDSLAQLRMSDGGALSVRSETQIKLDAYRYSGRNEPGDNFLVSILRGGFRTITGLIAHNNRDNFHVLTSAMTIGVRGTDFEVVHVLKPAADVAPGTYNRVYAGITTMQNRAGATILVNRDQTAFVPLAGNLPPALVLPPAGIFGKPTPVPPAAPLSRGDGAASGDSGKGEARAIRSLPAVQEKVQGVAPATAPATSMTAPLLNPIDTPRVLETAPATTTISPTLISPTISPTLTSPTTTTTTTISPTLISPTISPTLTSPTTTTTTISPTLISPTTTTISPTLTTISPTTTTISPTLTSPTTTTIIKR